MPVKGSRRRTDAEIAKALKKSHGFVSYAAKALKLSSTTVHNRINASPYLQRIIHEIREGALDFTEVQLKKLVAAGEMQAIRFHLSCLGKKRGFVERQELTGADGGPIQMQLPALHIHFDKAPGKTNGDKT